MGFVSSGFTPWTPAGAAGSGYDVCCIAWEADGLVCTLVPDGPGRSAVPHALRLVWAPERAVSYHVTDETYRADCWGLDFAKDGRFYVSRNSGYIRQMRAVSPLFPADALHFLIVGTNTVADVLATAHPRAQVTEAP